MKITHMGKGIVKYLGWFDILLKNLKKRTVVQTVWMEGSNADKSRN